jgi:tRNA (mo5U34)-methyltransferase
VAKELLGSRIEIDQAVSIYELQRLGRTFDIVICFGVYYHLYDPFYAFAQLRHCCHEGTRVLLDGDVGRSGLRDDEIRCHFSDSRLSTFVPSLAAFEALLTAAYFSVRSHAWLNARRKAMSSGIPAHALRLLLNRPSIDRAFTICEPFTGANALHPYAPPFGLSAYDDRFRDRAT